MKKLEAGRIAKKKGKKIWKKIENNEEKCKKDNENEEIE